MTETLQSDSTNLEDKRVQDIYEAHELAGRVDKLESKRARVVGGMAMLADEYVKQAPVDPDKRANDADDAVVTRLAKANGFNGLDSHDQTSRLNDHFGSDGLTKRLDNSIERQNADEANDIESNWQAGNAKAAIETVEDLQAAGEVAKTEVAKLDAQLKEVYEGGLTPDEKEAAQRQDQAAEIVNSVRNR